MLPVHVLCALQTTRKAPGCLASRVSGDGRNTRACNGPISIATLLEVVDAILNDKPVDLESIETLQQMLVRGEIVEQVVRLEADRYGIHLANPCFPKRMQAQSTGMRGCHDVFGCPNVA